ncbi:MAG TPA: hypothetical protein VK545_00480 [Streptomyces sp.]|nr:hypothetical protein [Streptomyces sp.]
MTVAVNFDTAVCPYWPGPDNPPTPGALDALRHLLAQEPVIVYTTRDRHKVTRWLTEHDIIALADSPVSSRVLWDGQGLVLVTNRQLSARVYLDARAVSFTSWEQALRDLDRPSRELPPGLQPVHPPGVDPLVVNTVRTALGIDLAADPGGVSRALLAACHALRASEEARQQLRSELRALKHQRHTPAERVRDELASGLHHALGLPVPDQPVYPSWQHWWNDLLDRVRRVAAASPAGQRCCDAQQCQCPRPGSLAS